MISSVSIAHTIIKQLLPFWLGSGDSWSFLRKSTTKIACKDCVIVIVIPWRKDTFAVYRTLLRPGSSLPGNIWNAIDCLGRNVWYVNNTVYVLDMICLNHKMTNVSDISNVWNLIALMRIYVSDMFSLVLQCLKHNQMNQQREILKYLNCNDL